MESPAGPAPRVRDLFVRFFLMSITGFGGVLPFAYRMIVEKQRWMTPNEFAESLSFAQFLPGANILNLSVLLGQKYHGVAGALACVLGLILAPSIMVVLLGVLYLEVGQTEVVHDALDGVTAAAAGLILATALKMAAPLVRGKALIALACAAAVLLAVAVFGVRLPIAVVLAAPVSVALAWWSIR